ncbi:hypothetical protein [Wielerella bovis]|uniref:hypothetical protein n=1 Tax=Wielerella bovis TaxID=2917790 RepID=UPI00201920CB|nr:hypothetical protein [Wielerella bovis]ULJ60166.1 hypothetical protein MIS44_11015 [Wielerella bovis]
MNKLFSTLAIGTMLCSLSGCVVADDSVRYDVATASNIGTKNWLFFSASDGYYYDQHYNRLPYGYRPSSQVRIRHINNIDDYRRQHTNWNHPAKNRPTRLTPEQWQQQEIQNEVEYWQKRRQHQMQQQQKMRQQSNNVIQRSNHQTRSEQKPSLRTTIDSSNHRPPRYRY